MVKKKDQKKFWRHKQIDRRSPEHPVIQAFVKPKINFVKKHIHINKDTTLLDVGCGNGYFTHHWAKLCNVTGVDFSKEMLKNNSHNKLVIGDAENLPFDDNSFDIIFCSNLLHHLENIETVLKEMKRVSKKYVVISEPNRNNLLLFLFAIIKKEERGILQITKNFIIKVARSVGLNKTASLVSGMIYPNKTKTAWLNILKIFDRPIPMGAIVEIIFEK